MVSHGQKLNSTTTLAGENLSQNYDDDDDDEEKERVLINQLINIQLK